MATDAYPLSRPGDVIARRMVYNHLDTNSRQGGDILFVSEQEVDAIIAANKRDAEIDQRKRVFRHVARVPLAIWEQAYREGWQDDQARWDRWLRDPDNRVFLVTGKI